MIATSLATLALALHLGAVADPATAIARQPRAELGAVSYDGHRGDTSRALDLIRASAADPVAVFVSLASSSSPVARVAAAAGLRDHRDDPRAQAALAALVEDKAPVDVMRGCLTDRMTVADAVADVIAWGEF